MFNSPKIQSLAVSSLKKGRLLAPIDFQCSRVFFAPIFYLFRVPLSLNSTGRHCVFLNSTGDIELIDRNIKKNNDRGH